LAGVTPGSLANIQALSGFWEKLRDPDGRLLTREERQQFGLRILGTGLALALYQQGWRLCASPGKLELERNGIVVSPFPTVFKLSSGDIAPKDWLEKCRQAEILDIHLAPAAAALSAGH